MGKGDSLHPGKGGMLFGAYSEREEIAGTDCPMAKKINLQSFSSWFQFFETTWISTQILTRLEIFAIRKTFSKKNYRIWAQKGGRGPKMAIFGLFLAYNSAQEVFYAEITAQNELPNLSRAFWALAGPWVTENFFPKFVRKLFRATSGMPKKVRKRGCKILCKKTEFFCSFQNHSKPFPIDLSPLKTYFSTPGWGLNDPFSPFFDFF